MMMTPSSRYLVACCAKRRVRRPLVGSTSSFSTATQSSRRRRSPNKPPGGGSRSSKLPPPPSQTPPPPPPSSSPIPTRHSRKQLPPVCNDPVLLQDLTQQVLEAPAGSLFFYDEAAVVSSDNVSSSSSSPLNTANIERDRQTAWLAADAVVQKVEFLVRGHAARLPGTRWYEWTNSNNNNSDSTAAAAAAEDVNSSTNETLGTLLALTDRVWEEGHVYMTLRTARLEEVWGPKPYRQLQDLETPQLVDADKQEELLANAKEQALLTNRMSKDQLQQEMQALLAESEDFAEEEEDLYDDDESDKPLSDNQEEEDEASYMDDFALPGPTVAMYDAVLDALAVGSGSTIHEEADWATPAVAQHLFGTIMSRHLLDGGDATNTNPYTVPTVWSYNAPIRVAANQFYENNHNKNHHNNQQQELRDQSVLLAFECLAALQESARLEPNPATYKYMLQVVSKFFPPSLMRANVATGLWHHAATQGLVTPALEQAYIKAYQVMPPPQDSDDNYDDDDYKTEWMQQFLAHKDRNEQDGSWPQKWRRNSRARLFDPKDDTY